MRTKDLLRNIPTDIYDIPDYPIKLKYDPNQDSIWFTNQGECVVAIKLYGDEYRYTIYSDYIDDKIKLLADRLQAYMDLLGLKEKRVTLYDSNATIPSFKIEDLDFMGGNLMQKISEEIKNGLIRSTTNNIKKYTKRNILSK